MNELIIESLLFAESKCINPQDAIVVHLLNEGLKVHEIIYLKNNSLDVPNRVLTVTDSSRKKRKQAISQKTAEMYQKANTQTQYFIDNYHSPKIVKLKENGYLIKASLEDYAAHENMIQEMDSVIYRTIFNRFHNIKLGRLIFLRY